MNKEELVERVEIEGSPFVCVTTEEGSFIVMGRFRMTKGFRKKEDAIKEATEMTWNNIVNVMSCIIESLKEFNELKEKYEN